MKINSNFIDKYDYLSSHDDAISYNRYSKIYDVVNLEKEDIENSITLNHLRNLKKNKPYFLTPFNIEINTPEFFVGYVCIGGEKHKFLCDLRYSEYYYSEEQIPENTLNYLRNFYLNLTNTENIKLIKTFSKIYLKTHLFNCREFFSYCYDNNYKVFEKTLLNDNIGSPIVYTRPTIDSYKFVVDGSLNSIQLYKHISVDEIFNEIKNWLIRYNNKVSLDKYFKI